MSRHLRPVSRDPVTIEPLHGSEPCPSLQCTRRTCADHPAAAPRETVSPTAEYTCDPDGFPTRHNDSVVVCFLYSILAGGRLPPGVHVASWDEVVERLDRTPSAIELLAAAGCRQIWLNGSFVTAKDEPGDFDARWDTEFVDLDVLDPVCWTCPTSAPRRRRASVASCSRTSSNPVGPVVGRVLPERTRHQPQRHRRHPPLGRGRIVITNEVQYRATTAHLERFEQAAANIEARPGKRTKLDRLVLDAVRAQADDLRLELADFDQLRSGTLSTFDAASLGELSMVLVKARIARGWTQRQLAEALGMAEQQIQRYEAHDYRSTSLARLCDIANALGVTVAQHAELKPFAA